MFLFHVTIFQPICLFLLIEKDPGGRRPQPSKPSKSSRQSRRSQLVRPALSRPPREDSKESRHPFALYGSGEKDADTAGRKTHNVGPAASTNEVIIVVLLIGIYRSIKRMVVMIYVSLPDRSTNLLCVLRPGGRWSVRSIPSGLSGGEPSQLTWTRPEKWSTLSSTPGSLSTCVAFQLGPDRTHTGEQKKKNPFTSG